MKKVLIVSALDIWSLGKKTGAQSLWETLKGYRENSWQVVFLSREKTNELPLSGIVVESLNLPWIKKIANSNFVTRSLWWLWFQIAVLTKAFVLIRKEKIDVFYGYEVHAVPAAKLLSFIFKKPVVSRFQGTILSQYLEKPKAFWKLRHWWHVLAFKIRTDLVIMANDGTEGDKVLRFFCKDMGKVRFWTNGVDKDLFFSYQDTRKIETDLGISNEDKVLLSVSRLEKWKGVDRTISALPSLLKKFPKVRLLIIGEGAERKTLESLVEKLHLQENVNFLGAIEHVRLPAYYQMADIFVSMYDLSNVGNPLFEAMLSGKCIVTFDIGATNKFVKNGETGVLLRDRSSQTVSKKLIELLSEGESVVRLGKNARVFADKNFWSWEERMKEETREVSSLNAKN